MGLSDIALNFVPLKEQDRSVTIYRKLVDDSSLPKADDDFRVNLPEKDGDDEWRLFDVSTSKKENYESYSYNFWENSVLTVHLIYSDLLEFMIVKKAEIEYYIPRKVITLKEVRFVTERFNDGATEIVVKPYYLKTGLDVYRKNKRPVGCLNRGLYAVKAHLLPGIFCVYSLAPHFPVLSLCISRNRTAFVQPKPSCTSYSPPAPASPRSSTLYFSSSRP